VSKTKQAKPRRLSGKAKQLARDVAAYAETRHLDNTRSYYQIPAQLLTDLKQALTER
jgi:hypothetical protein